MTEALKKLIRDTFEAVAEGYDSPALRFFAASAAHMAETLRLRGDEHVLDVACGTGHATVALAQRLPRGRVTALDFSAAMLARARAKAEAAGMANVDFVEADMQELPWKQRFDTAVCAFGVFFVEDMDAQLRHIAGTVKPGGRVMITSFAKSYMEPMRSLLMERVQRFGVEPPPQTWLRIADEDGCRSFFAGADIARARVERKDVGYFLSSADDWWQVVWNAGYRRLVGRIPADRQAAFKAEHLAEVEALRTSEGIALSIPVLFTSGDVR